MLVQGGVRTRLLVSRDLVLASEKGNICLVVADAWSALWESPDERACPDSGSWPDVTSCHWYNLVPWQGGVSWQQRSELWGQRRSTACFVQLFAGQVWT